MAQGVGISEHDTTASVSGSHQLCLPFLHVDCTGIEVVGGWDPGWRPVSGRIQRGDGRLEVVVDHASCAERQRKHLLFRFGRIVYMVFELTSHGLLAFFSLFAFSRVAM